MEHRIERITARQILDSRGTPTVSAQVLLTTGVCGWAAVPSGASTGANEACELRDGEAAFSGKGVLKAVGHVNVEIDKRLRGHLVFEQQRLDQAMIELDGTKNKSNLGANAILAVSLALAHAGAKALNMPLFRYLGGINAQTLPTPMMNILNGGAHADNNIDIQEFMIRPVGAKDFHEALRMGAEVYAALGKLLKEKGLSRSLGDEGGYAPNLEGDEQALKLLVLSIERAGYAPGEQVAIALDVAATEWRDGDAYKLPKRGKCYTRGQLIDHYERLTRDYPIDSIEDPFSEEDFEGFAELTRKLGPKGVQVVGDDLFTTNPERLEKGIRCGAGNAILVKPNQIGTLTETMTAVRMAQRAGFRAILSHRSGETEDSSIADIAVALNAGQIKTGAPARSDRTAKYNRLLAIEDEIYKGSAD